MWETTSHLTLGGPLGGPLPILLDSLGHMWPSLGAPDVTFGPQEPLLFDHCLLGTIFDGILITKGAEMTPQIDQKSIKKPALKCG